MKSKNWKAAGLTALVSLLAANTCKAADMLFSEAVSKCVRNHADPEKVFPASEASGWHSEPHLNRDRRLKEANGAMFLLKVDVSLHSGSMVHSCSVVGDNNSGAATLNAAQNFFGVPPSQESSQVAEWVFVEREGQRIYFRGEQLRHVADLTTGEVLHVLAVGHGPSQASPTSVIYKEVTKIDYGDSALISHGSR